MLPAVRAAILAGICAAYLCAGENSTVSVKSLRVPQKARDRYIEAEKKLAKHDSEGAKKKFEEALEIAPEYAAAWNALGVLASDAVEKEAHFRHALECDAENLDAHLNLGGWLLKTGRADEALPYNQRAAMELPTDAQAQLQFGMNLYHLGRLADAERALTSAKKIDPEHYSMSLLFLAEIYARRGEKPRAVAELEALLSLHPAPELARTVEASIKRLR